MTKIRIPSKEVLKTDRIVRVSGYHEILGVSDEGATFTDISRLVVIVDFRNNEEREKIEYYYKNKKSVYIVIESKRTNKGNTEIYHFVSIGHDD